MEAGFKRTARLVWALFDVCEDLDEERKIMEAAAAKVQLQFLFCSTLFASSRFGCIILDD